MALLWHDDAAAFDKIALITLIVAVVGPCYIIFEHRFIPAVVVYDAALRLSVILTLILAVVYIWRWRTGRWRPNQTELSRARQWIGVMFGPFMAFALIWLNIVLTGPYLITWVAGQSATIGDRVTRYEQYSARACDHRLLFDSLDTTFFQYCVSESDYYRLPSHKIDAEVRLYQSQFGKIVDSVQVPFSKREES